MKKHLVTLAITAFSFFAAISLNGAPAKEIYGSDIKAEQRQAEARIKDAENDLQLSSNAFGNATYKYAWVYLNDCGVKLDMTKAQIKEEPARIAVAVNGLGFNYGQASRKELSDKYYSIKKNLDHSFLLMSKLEEDLGKKIGVDVATVRKYMSALKILCEKTKDPQYCDLYDRMKSALESNDIAALQAAILEAAPLISKGKADNPDANIEDVPTKTNISSPGGVQGSAQTQSAATGAANSSNPAVKGLYVSMQEKCNQGDQKACECLQMLDWLDQAVRNGDPNAAAWVNSIFELDQKCKNGDQSACDKRDQLISQLNMLRNSNPNGPLPSVPSVTSSSAKPAIPSGKTSLMVGGKELIFNNGQSIETTYIGGQGQLLKQERVLKIVDMGRQPPYDVVSQRNWKFAIKSDITKSVAGEGCVYRFTFLDEGGLDAFTVKSWSVRDESGATIASGDSALTLDATFKTPGSYTVEVRGVTQDLGSEFTITSVVEISF
jgi:hypothetical protein